jgi:hypothetical protein
LIRIGFINYEIVYPIICEDITLTSNYLWEIQLNGKFGLLENDDKSIKIISNPIFDSIDSDQYKSYNIITKNGEKGIYHHDVLIEPEYDEIIIPQFLGWKCS